MVSDPASSARPVSIAIAALGGQGGGVLAEWLVSTAEHHGWIAQSTSVPGVAQRTGTTVYYVEVAPRASDRAKDPIMALMPTPGDVDIVVAAELMEAGRTVMRGLVTPDRTTLIASSHRIYGITEKSALADGIADSKAVLAACAAESKRLVCFDMETLANEQRTVISAILLGAVAGSASLPFARADYEAAIRESGVSVEGSLAGFGAGFERALSQSDVGADGCVLPAMAAAPSTPAGRALDERIRRSFPAHLHGLVVEGVRRLMDYQDAEYAAVYLDRLDAVRRQDEASARGTHQYRLTASVARYLALWMAYEDTIRVADLKTRASRFERIRADVRAAPGQILSVTDYLHPRYRDFCETLPAWIGGPLLGSRLAARCIGPRFNRGRHIGTGRLAGFLLLYLLARMRGLRRTTLRHRVEQRRIEAWLTWVVEAAGRDPALGVEVAECGRLIKGYSDTHERGLENFQRIRTAVERSNCPPAALRGLRMAALADEDGSALAVALAKLPAAAT